MRKVIRRTLWAGIILATAPAGVGAQANGNAGRGGFVQRLNGVLDQLDLSADQKSKIDDVLQQAREDGLQLRSELADLSPSERQAKVRDFTRSVVTKVDADLTPEQVKKFDDQLAESRSGDVDHAPATAPAGQTEAGFPAPAIRRAGGAAGGRLEQFKAALAKLDLTDDQKTRIHTMFEDLKPQTSALREADPTERREKATALFTDLREKLAGILTPDQQQSLRESLQSVRAGSGGAATRPAGQPSPAVKMNGDDDGMQMAGGTPATPHATAVPVSSAGYTPGQTPTDLKLDRLDQSPVQLSAYKGRVVALVFGSYSCPTFRDHAEELNSLSKQLGSDAVVLLVYTREANPVDGWQTQRNKDNAVNVNQTHTPAERSAMAQTARLTLHLTLPVIVDDAADKLATAFGVMPNGCVVLNRMGTVTAKFHWFETVSARHAIDEAIAIPVVMSIPASATDLR